VPLELEAAGDAITGAVLGRAVEPEAGEGRSGERGACLNCGVELIGPHCHGCGQKAKVHRTLRSYGHDLLHGVFHFEGKVWKTLPMLAFKPGELTRRYIHGERAKFVSPLALFLFGVFLMFAVVGGLAGEMHVPENGSLTEIRDKLKGKPLGELDAQRKQQQQRKDALDAQIKKIEAADGNTKALEKQSDAIEKEIDDIDFARGIITGKKYQPYRVTDMVSGWPALDAKIKAANENPNLFLYKLQSSAYKYSWALIPLSVPFVWLLFFWKRQFKIYDHAIFVTYSLTFMLFLTVVLTVVGFANLAEPWVPLAGVFVPPLHMYKQLRGAYRVSRIGGIIRTFALATFGTIVLSLFLVLLLVLGVL
jgi:Protein of unknown function (DUF3667)